MQLTLQLLELKMQMNFSLKEITERPFNRISCVHAFPVRILVDVFASLSLRGFCPKDEIVTWKDHLKEFSIVQATILIDVEILDH